MCTLFLITRRKNRVKRTGIMNIFYTKSTVLTPSKTFGACTIIFIRSMKLCPTQITCSSKRVLDPSGKTPKIEKEESGLLPYPLRKTWKRNAIMLG